MASVLMNRTNRPNTWLHRPACDVKFSLRSRPQMALRRPPTMSARWSLSGAKRTWLNRAEKDVRDPPDMG
jgi:hypothetical protein